MGGVDADDLAVDVGGLAGEDEADRGLEAGQIVAHGRVDVDELGGGAAQQLLGQGTDEALDGALDDALVGVLDELGGGADDEEAGIRAHLAHLGVEELVELLDVLRGLDAGGVEDDRGLLDVGVGLDELEVGVEELPDTVGHAALAADDDRAVEGGFTLLVPTQLLALGDAELTGEAGVDDLFQQALVGRQCTDLLGL